MKRHTLTNVLLAIIALLLLVLVFRPVAVPSPVHADSSETDFYVEPGTYTMRSEDNSQQSYGKVVIDLRTGRAWGFPTYGTQPYPFDPVNNKPLTSHPFQLGRFALEEIKR